MLRPLLLATTALLIAGCAEEGMTSVTHGVESVALFPDDPGRERVGALRYTGGLILSSDHDRFGGWSALEVSADGTRLLAISDSASWMTADLGFDDDGQLAAISQITLSPMLDAQGNPLSGDAADAEGLAPLGNGDYAVSFERDHRIARYALGADWSELQDATATPFPAPPGADRLRNNAGIEALAADGDVLWAGVEYPIVEGQPYSLWRFDLADPEAVPTAFDLNLTPGYGLTALEADGEGGLFIVERFFARNVGNRIRIGQLTAEALASGSGPLSPAPLAEITPDMTVDNIEAIAIAEINGETRLFVMSDDNFNAAQRTLLLSFAIEG